MSTWEVICWWVLLGLGVAGCGLCSGLEIGLYSLNRVRLHLLAHRKANARIIEGFVHEPAMCLGTLLIATSVMTNLVTSAMGVLLEDRGLSGWAIVAYDLAIVTPVLFVFAEVLPKDLFAAHADELVHPFARLLLWGSRLMRWTGVLPLMQAASSAVVRLLGAAPDRPAFSPRFQLAALVKEGVGYGLLSDEQSAMVERVIDLSDRTVGEEMVPWQRVQCVRGDDAPAVLWRLAETTSVSRFPVLEPGTKVAGVVSLYDALLHGQDHCPPLRALARPAPSLDVNLPLRQALATLRTSGVGLAIVAERGRPVGIVTVKDLIEPITGELASW